MIECYVIDKQTGESHLEQFEDHDDILEFNEANGWSHRAEPVFDQMDGE